MLVPLRTGRMFAVLSTEVEPRKNLIASVQPNGIGSSWSLSSAATNAGGRADHFLWNSSSSGAWLFVA